VGIIWIYMKIMGLKIMSIMLNNFFMIFQFSNKLMLPEDNFIKYNQKPTN